MKKTIFLICCVLISFAVKSYSQTYPIPALESLWGELTFLGPPSEYGAGDYGSVYRYNGVDTVINEQTYQFWGYDRFTRYDENKLYVIDNYQSKSDSTVEVIYYDFNLELGDSFLIPFTDSIYAEVEDVSNFVTLNGQTRKRLELLADEEGVILDWIEGIGDVSSSVFYEDLIGTYDVYPRIVCFSDSSGYVFKDENFEYSCAEIESIEPFIVDAGKDTSFCYCECDNIIRLGGNPSAFQVEEPTYKWTTTNLLPASYFLDDTTTANPIINLENLASFGDSVSFVLTVTDYYQNQKSDTVTVRAVQIGTTLVYFNPEINKGDTLILLHNEFLWGIEPYSYYWSPGYNISDINASNPKAWPDTTTRYFVYAIDSIGCKSPVDFVDIIVHFPDGILPRELNKSNSEVFPNPITTNSVLIFDAKIQSKLTLKIVNANGAVIFKGAFSENPFRLGNLIKQSGLYIYTISDDSGILASGKLVKH